MKSSRHSKTRFNLISGIASIIGLLITLITLIGIDRIINWLSKSWNFVVDILSSYNYIAAPLAIIGSIIIIISQRRYHIKEKYNLAKKHAEVLAAERIDIKTQIESFKKENITSIDDLSSLFSDEQFFQIKAMKKLKKSINIIEKKYDEKLSRVNIKEKPEQVRKRCDAFKIDFVDEINTTLQAATRDTINSLKRHIEGLLLKKYNHSFKVRVILNLIGDKNLDYIVYLDSTNNQEIKERADIGNLFVKDAILDDNCNNDILLNRATDECFGYDLVSDTALLESATSTDLLFCSNDTGSIASYSAGPNVLENCFNAKLCIPIYSRLDTQSDQKLVTFDAFLCVLIDNSSCHRVFLEDTPEKDPIVRLTTSSAVVFSLFFEEIKKALRTITYEKIENGAIISSQGYHKQINRRERKLW